MSSKSTILTTDDNEHWYLDCNEPKFKNKEYIGDSLTIEFSKKNIEILINNGEDLVIEVKAGSNLYNIIKDM